MGDGGEAARRAGGAR